MSQSELPSVMDEVLATLMKASTDWKKQNDEAALRRRVFSRLDKSADQIVLKLLGFRPDGHGWEIDHCNGRGGESAAGKFLQNTQNDAVNEWLSNVAMPVLTAKDRESLEASAKETYLRVLHNQLREKARNRAAKDAQDLVDALAESQNLHRVLEAHALVRGTSPNDSQ